MIKTKFIVTTLEDWISMLIEFEYKLKEWSDKSSSAYYNIELFIGDNEYCIVITVESNEEDSDTNRLNL